MTPRRITTPPRSSIGRLRRRGDQFKSAFDKSHDARLLYNIGSCERSQHHYARAVELVRQYLDSGSDVLTAQDRSDAHARLAALASLIVDLTITVDQPAADVYVDDIHVRQKTPLPKAVVVDIGRHKIIVKKAGYKDAAREVEVGAERTATVALTLAELPAGAPSALEERMAELEAKSERKRGPRGPLFESEGAGRPFSVFALIATHAPDKDPMCVGCNGDMFGILARWRSPWA